MDDYKEGMKLTDDEIDAIKPTQEECAKITAAMELYKPPEFKGCFANDEHNKLTKRKVSDAAQEKCLRVLSSMELLELEGKAEDRAEQERLMLEAEAEAQAKADDAAMWAERETDDMPKIFIPELDDEGDQ